MPFSYILPRERIAQRPVRPPEAAKLLLINRRDKQLSDSSFRDLVKLIGVNDVLVFNRSKVIPARLHARLSDCDLVVEVLLLRQRNDFEWQVLAKPLRKLVIGSRLDFGLDVFAEVIDRQDARSAIVRFNVNGDRLYELGQMPIPPYIRQGNSDEQDNTDYQNIFADKPGSVAAPTAGLHFSQALLASLQQLGVTISYLTLHVGAASFMSLAAGEAPLAEQIVFDQQLINHLLELKGRGKRIIAVGTTTVRALESMVRGVGQADGSTDLFIRPGFEFQIVSSLITNFHQPDTTHLALVEAFMGHELLERSYHYALSSDYRFLSYGDAMFIL